MVSRISIWGKTLSHNLKLSSSRKSPTFVTQFFAKVTTQLQHNHSISSIHCYTADVITLIPEIKMSQKCKKLHLCPTANFKPNKKESFMKNNSKPTITKKATLSYPKEIWTFTYHRNLLISVSTLSILTLSKPFCMRLWADAKFGLPFVEKGRKAAKDFILIHSSILLILSSKKLNCLPILHSISVSYPEKTSESLR